MDNLIFKIRQLKPEKLQCFSDDGAEWILILDGKTGQQVRTTLESENPVKVRLMKGEEILFTWSADAPQETGLPPASDLELILKLVLKSQETIGKIYQDMMTSNRSHIEAILKAQSGVISRLETRVSRLDERLEDSLDVHMDAALNGPQVPAQQAETAPASPVSNDMINQLIPMILEALSKKAE